MRVGEEIGLDDGDVDPGERVIVIRDGKFGKSRQLVIHPTTADVLAGYARARNAYCPRPPSGAFFGPTRGPRLPYPNVPAMFRKPAGPAGRPPPPTATAGSCCSAPPPATRESRRPGWTSPTWTPR